MITMEIKLSQDSAGALTAEFLNGKNSVSQNNSGVNYVKVYLDGFTLENDEFLQIAYATSLNESDPMTESVKFELMSSNDGGASWYAEIPALVRKTRGTWYLDLRTAKDNAGETAETSFTEYSHLIEKLSFEVNATIYTEDGGEKYYPTMGDVTSLFNTVRDVETKATELDAKLNTLDGVVDGNIEAIEELAERATELEEKTTNLETSMASVQSDVSAVSSTLTTMQKTLEEQSNELSGINETVETIQETDIPELEKKVEGKYERKGGIIEGDVVIQGNLSVAGKTTTFETVTLQVKDNLIVANSDGVGVIENAGFAVRINDSEAYAIVYVPEGNGVKIGLGTIDENGKFTFNEGQAQFLATRADSLTGGNTAVWNEERNTFVDSGVNPNELIALLPKVVRI